jgi:hypothetical protein
MAEDGVSNWLPKGGQRVYAALSIALVGLAFATVVYKAWTLSFTIDEAFTYNTWCAGPLSAFFTISGYNNHPLNTLLCRISLAIFEPGEFTMRLPSVLFGVLYLVSVYRIALLLFDGSFWMLIAVGVNCANPLVLDHFATARGYGMGLALWTLGAYYAARWISQPDSRALLIKAGAVLGFSVAAYMTEAFAAAALGASLLSVYLVDRARHGGWTLAWRFVRGSAAPFVAAGLVAAVPILYGPLRLARPDGIDGESKYRLGVKALLNAVLFYHPTPSSLMKLIWDPLHKWPWAVFLVLLGMLLIAAVVVMVRPARAQRLEDVRRLDRQLLVFAIATLVTFLLLYIEPRLLHHPFFGGRRLLFTLPVIFLACPLLLVWLEPFGNWGRAASRAGAVVLVLLCAHMAAQYTPRSFFGWEFDAGSKTIASILRRNPPVSATSTPLRIGATGYLSHTLNFYRGLYGLKWIDPVTLDGPECLYDYYVVVEEQLPALRRFDPQVLYRDPIAQTVLAEPSQAFRARLASLRQTGFSGRLACQADLTNRVGWAAAGSAGVNGHFLADVMEDPESNHQRWTFERPAFLFQVNDRANLKMQLHIRLPRITYAQTGPVRLTVWINRHRLGEASYNSPEDHLFEQKVPPAWIREDGLTLVETTMDKYYIAPEDKQKLGYLFLSGGLVN